MYYNLVLSLTYDSNESMQGGILVEEGT